MEIQYQKQFGFHWDLVIVKAMVVIGHWAQALTLLEHIQTLTKDALNPAHQSYVLALKSYLLTLHGEREEAIESYRDARMVRLSLDSPNAIRSFVLLQRLSFVLNMRISSDETNKKPAFNIVDQPSLQLKYLRARVEKSSIEPPEITYPWAYCLMVIDYLFAIEEESYFEQQIEYFWEQAETLKFPFLFLALSKIAHSKFANSTWEKRLQKQLIDQMAEQPQYFQLQEHWRNKERLL